MKTRTIDLGDTELFVSGDPHATWARLRRERPVYWNGTGDGDGFWALTRYRDLARVYRDPATFSSEQGTVMGGSYRSGADSASGQMLICSDPPEHRLLRQQLHQGFTQEMVRRVSHRVAENVREAVDRFVAAGGGDFATEVAPMLPAGLLRAVFDLDHDQIRHLLGLTRAMIGHRDPELQTGRDESMTLVGTQVEILDLFAELIEQRRRRPGDDLVSLLLRSEINGRPMTESQILYNCLNVAVGGDETTPYTATAGVLALIEHPEQAERFRRDADLLPTAVEEIFRWTSTNAYVRRTATRDVEIGGTLISRGQSVTLWNASANRDEEQFPDADRFDLARSPNQHLAFGIGAHKCIGMNPARAEITILFEQLRSRGLRFALAGPVERLRSNFMLGIKHLPVTVTR
ncbi:cytochrome P450 [Dactylosporangium roseum]|uniref:cytochrome P450 n=1 Tax=Dactylosporangium roseum TaxID=47989 RepID=UPI0021B36986|nr:cytochrome P450 [Dactylosporangium roseum]